MNKKNQGFTLIEFLIYTGIVVFTMTMFTLSALNALQSRSRINAMGEVNRNARFVMEKITHSIRNYDGIVSATGDTLVLESSFDIYNPTTFSLQEGKILMSRGTSYSGYINTEKVIITNLSFSQMGETGVEIEMTISSLNPLLRQEYDFQRTFRTIENIRKL